MSAKKDLATQVREYTDKLHRDYAELKQERAALEERKAFLFAAPLAWKRMAAQMLQLPSAALRRMGGAVLVIGLAALWWCRH